jgi:UTP--glucose-1-phosphate uridylyltransferase
MPVTTTSLNTIIIPAAGKGKRMRPATKITAKELLPVYDRLVIDFAIDEAIAAGAARIIVVVSQDKPGIRQFLGNSVTESPASAHAKGKDRASVEVVYVTQDEPKGLGHAILCCRDQILPGPVGVILPDDIIMGSPCLSDMARSYTAGHMIAAMEVAEHHTPHYGIFSLCGSGGGVCVPVTGMVEKPSIGHAPSTLAAVGRYILHPMIFDVLERTPKGAGDEVQLTDAIAIAARSAPLVAFRFTGTRHDCGCHDGLISASVARQAEVKACRTSKPPSIVRTAPCSMMNGTANGAQDGEVFGAVRAGRFG